MSENGSSPRTCNTGAQNTTGLGLRACVDWVSATFKFVDPEKIFPILNMDKSSFIEMNQGMFGYRRQLKRGNIRIFFDGREDMGIHIEMSGQGCREFERTYPYMWSKFFYDVIRAGGSFTRIDAAIDDFKGYYTIDKLTRKVKSGECSSKFKSAKSLQKIRVEDGADEGNTLYFGSPTSRIKVRFYDKLKEREAAGKEIEEGIEIWNRAEIEMKDERADAFALLLVKQYESSYQGEAAAVGKIVSGVLRSYVNFLVKQKDSNKSRWPIAKWWIDFLQDCEKLTLTEIAPDRTLEETKEWFQKQIPRTMGKLFLALDSNIDYFVDLLNLGMERLTEDDLQQIESYKAAIKEKMER